MVGYYEPICAEGCGLEQSVMYCSLDYLLFVQKFKIVSLLSLNLTCVGCFFSLINIVNTKITYNHFQPYLFCVSWGIK